MKTIQECPLTVLPGFPLSPLSPLPPDLSDENLNGFTSADADPIIKDHAIHWILCGESYRASRRRVVEGWDLQYNDLESCIYRLGCDVIVAFRGTKDTKDLYDDGLISTGQQNFPRSDQAENFIAEFTKLNQDLKITLTGHSLGGAIARVVAQKLALKAVTFNSASPPSAPVTNSTYETPYHIQFDLISAWQGPLTIRIDKGYWPMTNLAFSYILPFTWLYGVLSGVIPSHSLHNFSNQRVGERISAETENSNFNKWFQSLPFKGRNYVLVTLLGMGGGFHGSLPLIS